VVAEVEIQLQPLVVLMAVLVVVPLNLVHRLLAALGILLRFHHHKATMVGLTKVPRIMALGAVGVQGVLVAMEQLLLAVVVALVLLHQSLVPL